MPLLIPWIRELEVHGKREKEKGEWKWKYHYEFSVNTSIFSSESNLERLISSIIEFRVIALLQLFP